MSTPQMVESASKGAVLLASKEALLDVLLAAGTGPVVAGLLAGAGGGIAQVAVMCAPFPARIACPSTVSV